MYLQTCYLGVLNVALANPSGQKIEGKRKNYAGSEKPLPTLNKEEEQHNNRCSSTFPQAIVLAGHHPLVGHIKCSHPVVATAITV